MKKNAVVAIISITLCALVGIAAYQTVHIVGGWVSAAIGSCTAESGADCSRDERSERPLK